MARKVEEAIQQSDEEVLRLCPKRYLQGMTPAGVLALPKAEREAVVARARAELIRAAIAEGKGLDELLPEHASDQVRLAVKASRKIARDLCRRVEKRQESIQTVLSEVDLSGIQKTRAAFVQAAMRASREYSEELSGTTFPQDRLLSLS